MIVRATRLLRKMRGGAQAHLLEADDGHCYVVKFTNNPQHRRILVNEWIASRFLAYLQINAPKPAIIELSPKFIAESRGLHIQLGSSHVPVPPGRHFGSRFPGDPKKLTVYDFLPDILLNKVGNRRDFLGTLAFDKWMGNSDARQTVFYRAVVRTAGEGSEEPGRPAWIATMIDHGFVFDGPNWSFVDAPLAGLYHRPVFYEAVRSLDDFQPWLDRILNFPEHIVDTALRTMPSDWVEQDHEASEALLEKLLRRRNRIESLLYSLRSARANLFPNWK
ncbi:MAG: HipA family kinase [Acidobacteriota bacterium]